MTNEPQANRREFIKTSALTAGALALPRFSIAEPGSANGKINIAVVGAGGMGEYAVEARGHGELRGDLRRRRDERGRGP